MSFWEGLGFVTTGLICLTLFMAWRRRGLSKYPYAFLYLASFLILDPLRLVFYFKSGASSPEYFLVYWVADYPSRLLVSLAAMQFIELALEGSSLQIPRSAFVLSRFIVVVASGIVFVSYCIPRLFSRQGRFEYHLFLYAPSALLIILAWIACARLGRSEHALQPRMLLAALGLNSAIFSSSIAMNQFALDVHGRTPLISNFAQHGPQAGFLIMEMLWLYAVTCFEIPRAAEIRGRELIRASGSPLTLAAVFNRAKEEI